MVFANAGIFSLAALAANSLACVHAFEPTPEIAGHLRETVSINGLEQLHVHETAVAERVGSAVPHRFRGESGANEGMNFTTSTGEKGAELVNMVCLDDFTADHGIERIDLLKIDIQGNEPLALAGAQRLLHESRIGTIFMELNWAAGGNPSCSASESIRILDQAGYSFSKPGTRLQWRRAGDWMYPLSDIVARRMPGERPS